VPHSRHHDQGALWAVAVERVAHPELRCHLPPKSSGEIRGVRFVRRHELRTQEQRVAGRVIELLVLDDVATVREEKCA
jgi:hypothetical protein